MKINAVKFPAPCLGEETEALYEELYGETGRLYLEIISGAPEEIAVISWLIAALAHRMKAYREAE